MSYSLPLYVALFLALWSAFIGGVFSSFSEFVMRGLLRTSSGGGMESMQHINRVVVPTPFVFGILAMAPLSMGFAYFAFQSTTGLAQALLIGASAAYMPSVFFMTLFGNVPMNRRLDRMSATSREGLAYWREYGSSWTRLNHIRTLGCLATAALYLAASVALIQSGQV